MGLDFKVEPAWIGWRWHTGTNKGWVFGYRDAIRAAAMHGSEDARKTLNAYHIANGR